MATKKILTDLEIDGDIQVSATTNTNDLEVGTATGGVAGSIATIKSTSTSTGTNVNTWIDVNRAHSSTATGATYAGVVRVTSNSSSLDGGVVGINPIGRQSGSGGAEYVYGSLNTAEQTGSGNVDFIIAATGKARSNGNGAGTIDYVRGFSVTAAQNNASSTVNYLQGAHMTAELTAGTVGDVEVALLDWDQSGGTITGDLAYLRIQNDTVSSITGTARAIYSLSTLPSSFAGLLESTSFVKTGGTSSQFLKADGSVDTNTYLTSSDVTSSQWSDVTGGINYASGNVGIGTTSPSEKLTVNEGYISVSGAGTSHGYMLSRDGFDTYNIRNLDGGLTIQNSTDSRKEMTFDGDGNIGIGTTSPTTNLDVRGGAIIAGSTPSTPIGTASTLEVYENGEDATLAIHQDNGASTTKFAQIRLRNGGNDTYIKTPTSGQALIVDAEGLANAFVIETAGDVGIGIANPTEKLDIDGNVQATGDIKMYEGKKLLLDSDGDGFCSLRFDNTSGDVIYQSSGEHHFLNGEDLSYETVEAGAFKKNGGTSSQFLKADGSVDTNSYLPSTGGTLSGNLSIMKAGPALTLVDTTSGASVAYIQHITGDIHVVANSDTIFKNNATQTMVIQENGNVAIGNFSPTEKLEVDGNAKADSFIKDGGTSSQFLKADGSVDSNSYLTASSLSGYVDTTTTQTIGGTKTFSGNLGVGQTSPDAKLHINRAETSYAVNLGNTDVRAGLKIINSTNDDSQLTFSQGGAGVQYIQASNQAGTAGKDINLNPYGGNVISAGTFTGTNFILSSDSRLKENIEEVDNKSINVDWKTFEMKSNKGQKRYGVIAQELQEVHPEFVRTDNEGMKSVAYVDLLIAKIAELEARLEKLEK